MEQQKNASFRMASLFLNEGIEVNVFIDMSTRAKSNAYRNKEQKEKKINMNNNNIINSREKNTVQRP